MKETASISILNPVEGEAHSSKGHDFSLEKIKSPAFILDANGLILKSNKESQTWLHTKLKEIKGKTILEIFPELNFHILQEIKHLYPGKSLTRDLKEVKLSFFSTQFNNSEAILLLASVKDPKWIGEFTERLNSEKRKDSLQKISKTKLKGLAADWKMETKELNAQLLLGELAQLSIQESNVIEFLDLAVELVSRRLDLELVYVEQIAQSIGAIDDIGEASWAGPKNQIETYKTITEWVNPIVLDSKAQLYLHDDEILEIIHTNTQEIEGKKPTCLLALPLIFQGESIGILGLISFSGKGKQADFEYYGLLIADLLAGILNKYRVQKQETIQNARLQKIAEHRGACCWSVSPNGTVTFFNQSFIDSVVNKGAGFGTKLTYPNQKESKTKIGFSDWEEEYNKAFEGAKVEFECQTVDAKGNIYWWEIRLIPISADGLGNEEVLGIAKDVTQNRNQQSEIKQKQTLYLELIDAFDDVYFQADRYGVIQTVTSGIEKICGLKPAQIVGTNIKSYLPTPDQFHKELVSLREGNLVTGLELCLEAEGGKEVWLIANLKPIHSSWNEWTGFEGIARDHSTVRLAQKGESQYKLEATDALKVKERFLANISHEIRTPLNGIMGMAQLLHDTHLKDSQKEYVEIIQRSGDTLVHILNHLIDLSEAETGEIVLKLTQVHLPDLVKGISRLYMDQARLKNIEFSYEIDPELLTVVIDETRMFQLLNNLISNSFKFTIEGHIKVRISKDLSVIGKELLIEVSDTGSGLSASEQVVIKQMLSSQNPEYAFQANKGGIGLLTTKLISDAMQGQFGFVSSEGIGSTFWIKMPVKQIDILEEKYPSVPLKAGFFEGYVPEVLLVDDNAINLKVAYEILVKAGCQVEVATNGEEAVDKVKSGFYNVILMDIQMPVMDGVTATHIIKGMDLNWNPNIIAMTAYCLKEDKMRFVEAGMDDFIAKPISADKILSKVKYWTEKSFGAAKPKSESDEDLAPVIKHLTIRGELESVFDFDVLKGLHKHLGDDILLDSIHEFAIETARMVTEMDAALLMEDLDVLKSHSHTLKGNAGTFGVNHLSAIAKEIEFDLKNNKIAALSKNVEKLREAANQFLKSYNLLHKSHEWKN